MSRSTSGQVLIVPPPTEEVAAVIAAALQFFSDADPLVAAASPATVVDPWLQAGRLEAMGTTVIRARLSRGWRI